MPPEKQKPALVAVPPATKDAETHGATLAGPVVQGPSPHGTPTPAARAPRHIRASAQHIVVPAVLIACAAVNILATDFYAPSLAHLPAYFSTTPELAYLTMSAYFLTAALAQLVHGPLSERFGRRRLLLIGYLGFVVASLLAAVAVSIHMLIAARVLQAACGSVSAAAATPTIRALYEEQRALKILAYFGMFVGVAPAVGPLLGGYVYVWFGWRAIFLILALFAAVVWLLVKRFVPETVNIAAAAPLSLGGALAEYRNILLRRRSLAVLLPAAFSFGALFAFIIAAPFILINGLGVATEDFGLVFMQMVFAFMLGSFVAARFAARGYPPMWLFSRSCLCLPFCGLVILAPVLFGVETVFSVMLGMCLVAFFQGWLIAGAPLTLLGTLRDDMRHGPAVALLFSLQFAGGALAGGLVGGFQDGSAAPFAWTLTAMTFAGAGLFLILRDGAAGQN
ncbi:MAG: multidrug effflux MFS transporter [Alphaproteobacteria bacterium]|nr:multidrug effflux MFS transporter [Alphaproteobacteria bacterium]MDA8003715.1 multidrug effflux MFS transporter [Alphaproteobacteria bacterium]MDA8005477.1 multidrug effflux MFS transporter [Alphaproteobacteria bacterium]